MGNNIKKPRFVRYKPLDAAWMGIYKVPGKENAFVFKYRGSSSKQFPNAKSALIARDTKRLVDAGQVFIEQPENGETVIWPTFREAVEEHFKVHLIPLGRDIKSAKDDIKQSLEHFGDWPINKITVEDVESFLNSIRDNYSPSTFVKKRRAMIAPINRARRKLQRKYKGLEFKNPVEELENNFMPKVIRNKPVILTNEEIRQMLLIKRSNGDLPSEKLKFFLTVRLYTAMRPEETIKMRWDWIKNDFKLIFVPEKDEMNKPVTKNLEGRFIPLKSIEIQKILRREYMRRNYQTQLVFPNTLGRIWTNANHDCVDLKKLLAKDLPKSSFAEKQWDFYKLRHWSVNYFSQFGWSLDKLMHITGHKTLSAFKHYREVSREDILADVTGEKDQRIPITEKEYFLEEPPNFVEAKFIDRDIFGFQKNV